MTFWALLFLVLFLSALVAYLGDKVAKWAGKRHYRLFGLRPRQTATLVAVFTGVGIALLSYLGFLLVFRGFFINVHCGAPVALQDIAWDMDDKAQCKA